MAETQTVDLAAWLTRIWDEEERLARDRWTSNPLAPPVEVHFSRMDEPGTVTISAPGSSLLHTMPTEEYQRAYLVPAPDEFRLARIAADRKILELHHKFSQTVRVWICPSCAARHGFPCPTLRLLASPYKGRDGWQDEWE